MFIQCDVYFELEPELEDCRLWSVDLSAASLVFVVGVDSSKLVGFSGSSVESSATGCAKGSEIVALALGFLPPLSG